MFRLTSLFSPNAGWCIKRWNRKGGDVFDKGKVQTMIFSAKINEESADSGEGGERSKGGGGEYTECSDGGGGDSYFAIK